MCDTLCVLGRHGTRFAKNSDRPPDEVQLVGVAPGRPAGGRLATQYLEIDDAGASPTLLARPTWLWGAEHGVNAHRVAVGNERVYTAHPPAPDALIGMDLVRLVLERARSAAEGVGVLGALLERHGQGGVADAAHGEAYDSSFLVADPAEAWVVETSGRRWAARRAATGGAAISNRISLSTEWDRGSADLAPGTDVDAWRDPAAPTGHADRRLALTRGFVTSAGAAAATLGDVVAVLRDHGRGRWPDAVPTEVGADFSGVSVCMHIEGYMATTSSLVVDLPQDDAAPVRCWVAAGSPCVSVYVPGFPPQAACPPGAVPAVVGEEWAWRAAARWRDRVARQPGALAELRAVLDPLEAALWDEADAVAGSPGRWAAAAEGWSRRVAAVLGSR